MNIAYLISAHIDAPQLKRLIDALHTDAEFFVHIDLKSDLSQFTRIITNPHVHFISQRVDVVWGTMVEVEYQMNLLSEAVRFPIHFDRIFFLSGMDYPLWTPGQITEWLETQPEKEFLQGFCMDTPLLSAAQRTQYETARPFSRHRRWAILRRKMGRAFGIRKPFRFMVEGKQWRLFKGSAWWCISQELAAFLCESYHTQREVIAYFRDSFCPAETLIQSIAFNDPYWAPRCILTEGAYPGLAALTPLHFIDYDPVIQVMEIDDYNRLRASGKMFCRKVVSGKSDTLVDRLQKDASNQDVRP
uniref:Peptide O-xylosyltransferase n=1 Tax=uncultured bacterium fosmid pJB135F11 TaxID=1478051 RepID=A0A0H3UA87_9BACT|nr:hypothetical protein [uncultured bacterium fosmid pJB135F11]